MTRPQVVAHRGSSARHADNSWPAFRAAVAEGADAIECDVQTTRDGVLVVRHDLVLGERLVTDLDWADVMACDPNAMAFAGLLDFARTAPIDLLVEVKSPDASVAIARAIANSGFTHGCMLGSFHGPALAAARRAVPELRTSFMIGSVVGPDELVSLCAAYGAGGVHPCWESHAPRPHMLLDRTAVARLHAAGLYVTLWHEERPDELEALVTLGADAICTNTPAVLRRIVDTAADRERGRDPAVRGTRAAARVPRRRSSARHENS
jgi:glycerophosphoryl diester phosphodiesterase